MLPLRCVCGSRHDLAYYRNFADGLHFLRCRTCAAKTQMTEVPAEDLSPGFREHLAAAQNQVPT